MLLKLMDMILPKSMRLLSHHYAEIKQANDDCAHTVKGKGVSFMENVPAWHGSVAIKTEEFELT